MFLAVLLGASSARAQVYIVDVYGSEGFTDLQTALDTVPAGSTLLVKNRYDNYPIYVRKSVTIIGWSFGWGGVTHAGDDAVLFIDAGADAVVTLKDVTINGGFADGPSLQAIRVTSVGDLVLRDCEITGGAGLAAICDSYDYNAAAITVASARSVSIVGSRVKGGGPGDTMWRNSGCNQPPPHAVGGVGIAANAEVLLIEDSEITGGGGSGSGFDCGGDGSDAPWEPIGADGGNAVETDTAWISNSTLTGGAPGQGITIGCASDLGQPGSPGIDFAGFMRGDLPDLLTASDALLGKPITLGGAGFEPNRAALLFLSMSVAPPVSMRLGQWFLDAPIFFLGAIPTDAAGAFTLMTTFPDDPALIGTTLVVQATDLVSLSEPMILLPRRNKP